MLITKHLTQDNVQKYLYALNPQDLLHRTQNHLPYNAVMLGIFFWFVTCTYISIMYTVQCPPQKHAKGARGMVFIDEVT